MVVSLLPARPKGTLLFGAYQSSCHSRRWAGMLVLVRSRALSLHLLGVGSEAGGTVAAGPTVQCLLPGLQVLAAPVPGFQRRILQCPSIGEADCARSGPRK